MSQISQKQDGSPPLHYLGVTPRKQQGSFGAQKMLHLCCAMAAPGLPCPNSVRIHLLCLVDLLAKLFGVHTTPDMKVPEITDEQVREADKVLLATHEKCPFCKKMLDDLRVQTPQHRIYMKEHLQSSYLLGDPTSMSAEDVKSGLLRVRRFGGGLKELSLQNALEYWGDVERLPTLVKSMRQKKPMQVKFGKSDKAKTHALPKEEVAKYHLAWVSYAPTSGKYKNATYSQCHLKLHTQLQKDPQLVFQSPEPEGSWWPVACSKGLPMATTRRLRARGISKQSLVPFLVLHRVRAGEGSMSHPSRWILLSHKAIPCTFLGVTPSSGRGKEYQSTPLFLSWCYTELGQGRGTFEPPIEVGILLSHEALPCPLLLKILEQLSWTVVV